MNKIDDLIKYFSSDGVTFKNLGSLGEFQNIGVDKKIVSGQKTIMLLNYMDVYCNKYINKSILKKEVTASDKKISDCDIREGDLFLTPTSETINDIGHASVATENIKNAVYSYHLMRYRLFINNIATSFFIRYLFESTFVKQQILTKASGLTRFGLSKSKFASIYIPIPPLSIQQEIVNILDKFTQLEKKLEAELEVRRVQYKYYRNELLNVSEVNGKWLMNGVEVEWKTLRDVGVFVRGNGLQKKDFTEDGVGCIHYGQIYTYYGNYAFETKSYTSIKLSEKLKKAKTGDIIIATTSENVEDVCKSVVWLGAEDICISGETYILKPNQNSKYIAYYLKTPAFFDFKKRNVTGTKVIRLHGDKLSQFQIPIPSLEEQERIVGILDKFDALVNDLSIGLPAELNARRKQYEYYRNKLLDFKPVNHG